jgi:CRP/FNR family transcriptional regulator
MTMALTRAASLPDCATCPVRSIGVCARSGEAELSRLERTKKHRQHRAGTALAYPGDTLSHVGTVMAGLASLSRVMEDGRRQTIGLLHPGDFLGHPGRRTTPFLIEAVTDVELCAFEYRAFDRLLATAPQLHARLVEVTEDELDAARAWMLLLGRKSAREKLCSFLVYLGCRQSKPNLSGRFPSSPEIIYLEMTREQIADFLALTLETVSRQFSSLARDGVTAPAGRHAVRIPDFRDLLEAAGEDRDGGVIA